MLSGRVVVPGLVFTTVVCCHLATTSSREILLNAYWGCVWFAHWVWVGAMEVCGERPSPSEKRSFDILSLMMRVSWAQQFTG